MEGRFTVEESGYSGAVSAVMRFDQTGALDPSFGVEGHHRGRFTNSGRSGYLAARYLP